MSRSQSRPGSVPVLPRSRSCPMSRSRSRPWSRDGPGPMSWSRSRSCPGPVPVPPQSRSHPTSWSRSPSHPGPGPGTMSWSRAPARAGAPAGAGTPVPAGVGVPTPVGAGAPAPALGRAWARLVENFIFSPIFVPNLGDHFGYNPRSFWAGRRPLDLFLFFQKKYFSEICFSGLTIHFWASEVVKDMFFLIVKNHFKIFVIKKTYFKGLTAQQGPPALQKCGGGNPRWDLWNKLIWAG